MILASTSGRLYEQLEMLEMSELLWSLCEILLIDIVPGLFLYNCHLWHFKVMTVFYHMHMYAWIVPYMYGIVYMITVQWCNLCRKHGIGLVKV